MCGGRHTHPPTSRAYTTPMRICIQLRLAAALAILPLLNAPRAFAWGHDGHSMINEVAAKSLPADVPEFLRTKSAFEAMYLYGPVPDSAQWRSAAVPELNAAKAPDHEIDLEWADLIGPLPRKRYDYINALAAAQPQHPDIKMTPENVGTLPWTADEDYEALEAAFHDYRETRSAGKDTHALEAEIVFTAGMLGHFVADGSQPLHTTTQYNGWNGPNPNGYTTDKHVHGRFEGDFVHDNIHEADFASLVPAKPEVIKDVFVNFMFYLRHSNSLVERVYQLDKTGGFINAGTPESRAFVDERLAAGATKLRDLIYTAWIRSADPVPPYQSN
jgi:hypothetical protein